MGEQSFEQFGEFLRESRKRRGLRVTQAANATRDIARDPAAQISHPHLSQVERGKPIAISLPKLLTLSALYNLAIEDVIRRAPAELREALTAELDAWREARRPEPPPVVYLPHVVRDTDHLIWNDWLCSAENVQVPLGEEMEAEVLARRTLIDIALPAFLRREWASLSKSYWADSGLIAWGGYSYTSVWHMIVSGIRDWLLYAAGAGPAIAQLVATWTIEFQSFVSSHGDELVYCNFQDEDDDSLYGVLALPALTAVAIRWRQSAHLISATAPKSRGFPPPPCVADAAFDHVAAIVSPSTYQPVLDPPSQLNLVLPDLAASIREIAGAVKVNVDQVDDQKKNGPLHGALRDAEKPEALRPLPKRRTRKTAAGKRTS